MQQLGLRSKMLGERYPLVVALLCATAAVWAPPAARADCAAGALIRNFTGRGCFHLNGVTCEQESYWCTGEYNRTEPLPCDGPYDSPCDGGCYNYCPSAPAGDLQCPPQTCDGTQSVANNVRGCIQEGCDLPADPSQPQCVCHSAQCEKPTCVGIVPTATCKVPDPIATPEKCFDGLDNDCNGIIDEGCKPPKPEPKLCSNLVPSTDAAGRDPIHLASRAAVTEPFTDFAVEAIVPLSVTRTYTSADDSVRGTGKGQSFGRGWHHQWEATLTCTDAAHCRVMTGVSETLSFGQPASLQGRGAYAAETWSVYSRSDSAALGTGSRDLLARRPNGQFLLYLTDGRVMEFRPDCAHDNCSTTDNFCKDPLVGGQAHLSKVVDARGNGILVAYDRPTGLLLSLTDDLGHTLKLLAPGNACTEGLARSLEYDGITYLTYEYDVTNRELDTVRQWSYDGHGAVVRSYEYGSRGYLTKVRNESGDPIVEFGYDGGGLATSLVDDSSTVSVAYPAQDAVVVTSRYAGTSSQSSQSRSATGASSVSQGGYRSELAWQASALRCYEDFEHRVHYFDVDSSGRVVHHAAYAPGDYACSSSTPPAASVSPLLEEWFEYGLQKEVAMGAFVELDAVTATTRRSVLGDLASSGPGQPTYLAVTSYDYDQASKPGDPSAYRCSSTGAVLSGLLPCREVVSGYTLDPQGVVVPEQHTTYYSYDARGRLVRTVGPVVSQGTAPAGNVDPIEERSYWPDSGTPEDLPRLGRLREVRRYPGMGAAALTTTYDYDAFGPYQVVDPNGRMTLLPKDALGRVTAVVAPDGRSTSIRYYDGSQPRIYVQGSGAAVRLGYDSRGRIKLLEAFSSDPEAVNPSTPTGAALAAAWSESREYDPAGNPTVVERRDAAGVVRWRQQREYDADHRPRKLLHPEFPAAFAQWDYDGVGVLARYTDEEGRAVELLPDGLGRPVTARRTGVTATGSPVSLDAGAYVYDAESSSLRSVTDGAGRTTSYRHDDFGRVLLVDSPATLRGGAVRYSYDARGNVVARAWGATTTSYRYDGLNRLTGFDAVSTVGAPSVSYTFRYDETAGNLGRLTSIVGATRTTTFAYDEVGRLRFETVTDALAGPPLVTEHRYDADGRVDTVVHPTGLSVKYERDPATGRVTAVRNGTTGTAYASNVAFWPAGPLKALTFGNGTTLSQAVNLRYELLSISSGPVSLGYTPTLAGDVGAITSAQGEERFAYDFADRLTRRTSTTGVRAEPLAFTFAGGRVTQAWNGATARLAFAYDDQANLSAISSYDAAGASLAATVCLVHDAMGRLVLAGLAAPTAGGPDALACRREADVQQVIARYRYDAFNRRVARQDASGNWTVFAFDGDGQPLAELTSSGGAWAPLRDYVFLERTPLAQVEYPGSTPSEGYAYAFHVDHLGLPRALTSGSGQVVWSATPLPNGEVLESVTPDAANGRTVVTNLRLPGQYDERLLASVGLQGPYSNWHRWYLPAMGRYLEPDPIAMAGGFNGFYGPNWYGYSEGNPLRYTDSRGLTTWECIAPLHALGGQGAPSWQWKSYEEWLGRGKYNPLFHQYLCTDLGGSLSKPVCGGMDFKDGRWWSLWMAGTGIPSNDEFSTERCRPVKGTERTDACVASKIDKSSPRPDWYFLPTSVLFDSERALPFANCQTWAQDTLQTCQR